MTSRHVLLGLVVFGVWCVPSRSTHAQETAPPSTPWFVAAAPPAFLDRHGRDGVAKRSITEVNGGGVGLFDLDGDGDLDLFFAQGDPLDGEGPRRSQVFRNDGAFAFVDVTEACGLDLTIDACGVAVGDVDEDGDDDVYVTAIGDDALLRNDGGTLVRVANAAGASDDHWSTSAAFADLDGDGDLDLYTCNYLALDATATQLTREGATFRGMPVLAGPLGFNGVPDRLYRNRLREDGTLRFEAIDDAKLGPPAFSLGVIAFDADGDRDLDLYVANDSQPNRLLRNDGALSFVDVGLEAGVALGAAGNAQAGMGVAAGDVDGDQVDDLFVTNFSHDTNTLYRGLGDGAFKDASRTSGLGPPSFALLGFGCAFVDADLDGALDVVIANGHVYPNVEASPLQTTYRQPLTAFANDGRGRFRLRADAFPIDPCVGRGLAVGDLDGDGAEDLVITRLNEAPLVLRNTNADTPRVAVRLIGSVRSGRNAIGARITSTPKDGPSQVRSIVGGASFQSASSRELVFGLRDPQAAVELVVDWPSGSSTRVTARPGLRLTLTEGEDGEAVVAEDALLRSATERP